VLGAGCGFCVNTLFGTLGGTIIAEIKMLEISNVMDVTVDDLSPEQLQLLKDATDQFQMKCLMSFKKNRSGVPYLKTEMPRVLLSGETDATSFQEKEEALQAFRYDAEAMLGRHHKAFLSMFKQMMVGVFGPGMEQVFSRVSPHAYFAEVGETSSAQPTGAQPPLQSQPTQPPPQSVGGSRSSLLHKALGVSRCNLLCGAWGVSQSSHLYKKVNQFSSPTHTSLHMGIWHSVRLECRPIPLTR
jgi:hypothetical protein